MYLSKGRALGPVNVAHGVPGGVAEKIACSRKEREKGKKSSTDEVSR